MNLIGAVPKKSPLLKLPDVHLHDYGKEPRPGRKVGHVTVVCASRKERDAQLRRLLKALYPELGVLI